MDSQVDNIDKLTKEEKNIALTVIEWVRSVDINVDGYSPEDLVTLFERDFNGG